MDDDKNVLTKGEVRHFTGEHINIPYGYKKIGDFAFGDCTNLKSIVIPDSITAIGDKAFISCRSLTSIVIPDSVNRIGEWAFYDCTSLTRITVPDSVTSIGEGAFNGCSRLIVYCPPKSFAHKYCRHNSIYVKKSKKELPDDAYKSNSQDNIESENTQIPVTGGELEALIGKIDGYAAEISSLNHAMDDNISISGELSEIEKTMRKIQARLKEKDSVTNRKSTEQIEQFLEYYMPTFLKILNNYKSIEIHNVTDEDAIEAKKQVAEILPEIHTALEKEYNDMFDEINIDIVTDVKMLESMLSMDGLMDKNNIKK